MNIKSTNRNIQKVAALKKNFDYAITISELEPLIDGAVIDNTDEVNVALSEKLFKNFVIERTGFTSEEYTKLFYPIKKISSFDFMTNPYLNNISLNNICIEDINLSKVFYKPNEFVFLNEPTQDKMLLKKYEIGIFDNMAYTYVLKNNDFVWMSINPMEINTSAAAIKNAYGDVLVLGGGLAYYPYMVSLKDNVNSITIVEGNKIIYNLLSAYILPQFPNKKVNIIYDDAYNNLDHLNKNYDCIYIDIWEDNVKGIEDYKKFVKYEKKYLNTRFDYWLENSILDSVIVNIYQYFSAKLGTDEYQKFFSLVAPDLWNYLESLNDLISRPEQIDFYLSRQFAKDILKKM